MLKSEACLPSINGLDVLDTYCYLGIPVIPCFNDLYVSIRDPVHPTITIHQGEGGGVASKFIAP